LLQGIGVFIVRCTQAIRKFESLVRQIHSHSEDISNKLLFIESTNLFKFLPSKNGDELPSKSLYFPFQALWCFILLCLLLCIFSCYNQPF